MAESDSDTIVEGRYRVDPQQRLAWLDQPAAQAFGVKEVRNSRQGPFFALVLRPNSPPRADSLVKLSRQKIPGILCPMASETIHWPPEDGERVAIVFPLPVGKRLSPGPAGSFAPFSDDRLIHEILPGLVSALEELGGRYLAHRAIRADNIYLPSEPGTATVLGECVSALPGLFQPISYETIAGGQSHPAGRETGRAPDDLYAFGVLIAVLLFGGDPMAKLNDNEVLQLKITQGSCNAMVGKRRVSASMIEILRGLLCDDPKSRWSIEEVGLWLKGRRMSPKQVLLPSRARRSVSVAGRACEMDREVAQALASDWDGGLKVAASGELDGWLRRSLGDEERGKQITAYRQATTGEGMEADLLLTRVIGVLDPEAPIRYKQVSTSIEGFPRLLAVGYEDEGLRSLIEEMIALRLPLHWLELQGGPRSDLLAFKKLYEGLYSSLTNRGSGYGMERCLYEANESWPCMSPIVAQYRAVKLEELLKALEKAASAQGGASEKGEFVDRHIAAFCAARSKNLSTALLKDIDAGADVAARRLAKLRLLAEVQVLVGVESLPALAKALVGLLEPVIQSYHYRPLREEMIAKVESVAASGNLLALYKLMNDPDAKQSDQTGFEQAQGQHLEISHEIAWLEQGGLTDPKVVQRTARQVATVLCTLAALGVSTLALAMEVFG